MNNIVMITGPSGAGKTTLGDYLKKNLGYVIPMHCTTRGRRSDDQDGFYRYLLHDEYAELYDNNKFLISSGDGDIIDKDHGNFYGILKDDFEKNYIDNNIVLFVSYRDIERIMELNKSFNIILINLKYRNIKGGIISRISSNSRNHTYEQIINRVANAIKLEKEYGNIVEQFATMTIYTDEVDLPEMFRIVRNRLQETDCIEGVLNEKVLCRA